MKAHNVIGNICYGNIMTKYSPVLKLIIYLKVNGK